MSSNSNASNQTSRSNILTFSHDSQSSDLKYHQTNIYYKKFINKLGLLFRIDTRDLDALYDKISQCLHEGQGLAETDDHHIQELIEKASELQYNHSMLKNIIEILDRRFLRKYLNDEAGSAMDNLGVTFGTSPFQVRQEQNTGKGGKQMPSQQYKTEKTNQNEATTKKRKQIRQAENSGTGSNCSLLKQNQQNRQDEEVRPVGNQKEVLSRKYDQTVQLIFSQMNLIKQELYKMEETAKLQSSEPITKKQIKQNWKNYKNDVTLFRSLKKEEKKMREQYIPKPSSTMNVNKNTKLSLKQLQAQYQQKSQHHNSGNKQLSLNDENEQIVKPVFKQKEPQAAKIPDNQIVTAPQQVDSSEQQIPHTNTENTQAYVNNKYNLYWDAEGNETQNQNANYHNCKMVNVQQKIRINRKSYEEEFSDEADSNNNICTVMKNNQSKENNQSNQNNQNNQNNKSMQNNNKKQKIQNQIQHSLVFHNQLKDARQITSKQIMTEQFIQLKQNTDVHNPKDHIKTDNANIIFQQNATIMPTIPHFSQTSAISNNKQIGNPLPTTTTNAISLNAQTLPSQSQLHSRTTNLSQSRQKINQYLMRLEQRNSVLKKYLNKVEMHPKTQSMIVKDNNCNHHGSSLSNRVYTDYLPVHAYAPISPRSNIKNTKNTNASDKKQQQQVSIMLSHAGISSQQPNNNPKPDPIPTTQKSQKQPTSPLKRLPRKVEKQQLFKTVPLLNLDEAKITSTKTVIENLHEPQIKADEQYKKQVVSFEGRMDAQLQQDDKKYTIPATSSKSIFDQVRNVESHKDIPENHNNFKIRVGTEQILKIKDRVSEMFKRIKPIRDYGQLDDFLISNFSTNNTGTNNAHEDCLKKQEIRRLQFKSPQSKSDINLHEAQEEDGQYSNSHRIAKKSRSTKKTRSTLKNDQESSIRNNIRNTLHTSFQTTEMEFSSQAVNSSLDLGKPNPSTNKASSSIKNQPHAEPYYDSPSFSFGNHIGQDSVRSSLSFVKQNVVIKDSRFHPVAISHQKPSIPPSHIFTSPLHSSSPSSRNPHSSTSSPPPFPHPHPHSHAHPHVHSYLAAPAYPQQLESSRASNPYPRIQIQNSVEGSLVISKSFIPVVVPVMRTSTSCERKANSVQKRGMANLQFYPIEQSKFKTSSMMEPANRITSELTPLPQYSHHLSPIVVNQNNKIKTRSKGKGDDHSSSKGKGKKGVQIYTKHTYI